MQDIEARLPAKRYLDFSPTSAPAVLKNHSEKILGRGGTALFRGNAVPEVETADLANRRAGSRGRRPFSKHRPGRSVLGSFISAHSDRADIKNVVVGGFTQFSKSNRALSQRGISRKPTIQNPPARSVLGHIRVREDGQLGLRT